ncbi:hypothetical protein [Caballeronia grimmiae]
MTKPGGTARIVMEVSDDLDESGSSGNIDVVAHISDEAKLVKRTAPIYN